MIAFASRLRPTGIGAATQETRTNYLAVIGPLPPPVTGRTVVTARLVEELARGGIPYWLLNTAVPATGSPFRRKLRRARRLALYAFRLFRERRRAATAYIPVEATPGTVFTLLYVAAARLAGARIALHHHSYSYIEKSTFSMFCLAWLAGRVALHVTPCASAGAALSARYRRVERTAVLTNAFAIDPTLAEGRRPAQRDRLVLGHLSNLTVAKGVLTVIACFAELRRRGEPVELQLAGPIQEDEVERAVRNAKIEFGEAFHHHGPVDGAGKRAFYAAIDVFLFPTTFRNEVQPLVVLEALAVGVPAIAFGRACIPPLLAGGCGLGVPCDADFQSMAVRQIVAWGGDREALAAAGRAAKARFAQLRRQSLSELRLLVDDLATERLDQCTAPPPASQSSGVKPILFVGPLPPPVTGRTIVTNAIVRELSRANLHHRLVNTAVPWHRSPLLRKLRRVLYLAGYALPVLCAARQAGVAYITVEGTPGTPFTVLYAMIVVLLSRTRIVLHHHSYSYIDKPTRSMRWLSRLAGRKVLHVVQCDLMGRELRAVYPAIQNVMALSNAFDVEGEQTAISERDTLVLGHLSNLTATKGALTVIDCFAELRSRGDPVELRLAGPNS